MTILTGKRVPTTRKLSGERGSQQGLWHAAWVNLLRLLIVAAVIGLWQLAISLGWVQTFVVGRPVSVWHELQTMATSGELVSNVGATLYESLLGFALGSVVGVILGFILAVLPTTHEILQPFVMMLNTLPRFALAPLFLLWFGFGTNSKIALVFSLVVFVILINVLEGVASMDDDIVTVSRLLGASRMQMYLKVVFPSTLPWLIAGMRLSIAYAISGAVVGEMFAGQNGIGYLIEAGSGTFNVAEVFAGLVVVMIVAWLVDVAARVAERRVMRWRAAVKL